MKLGPDPNHTIQERCRWLTHRNCLYRQEAKAFMQILRGRGGIAPPPAYWTIAECEEFLDFAKVRPHLRNPY